MSLEKILAISKKPGLYKLINPSRGGYVVQSMIDNKKRFVKMDRSLSLLSEISIYTLEEQVPLLEVFKKIFTKEQGQAEWFVITHRVIWALLNLRLKNTTASMEDLPN